MMILLSNSNLGTLRAGKDLEDEQEFIDGTLTTFEGGAEYEVGAEPEVSLQVIKFKNE